MGLRPPERSCNYITILGLTVQVLFTYNEAPNRVAIVSQVDMAFEDTVVIFLYADLDLITDRSGASDTMVRP